MVEIETRPKLTKIDLTVQLQKSANRILELHLKRVNTIPVITDQVYAMGRAIECKMGVKREKGINCQSKKPNGGNRRERKLKEEMKSLRQCISKTSNELHQRKQRRKATNKEKKILKTLKNKMSENDININFKTQNL